MQAYQAQKEKEKKIKILGQRFWIERLHLLESTYPNL